MKEAWTIDLRLPREKQEPTQGHKWHAVGKDAMCQRRQDPKCEHCGNFKSELIGANATAWVCISCAVYVGEDEK